jgi:hypothetical protein
MTKYLAFDIETAKIMPAEATNFQGYRPLGISCAAIAWMGKSGLSTKSYHGRDEQQQPAGQMSRQECQELVHGLQKAVGDGFTLLTWNGLGFDFDILAEESGLHPECCMLARNHVDMMFHFFCLQGYGLGLDTAAQGLKVAGKTEGVDGALAPTMWAAGKYAEVLAYVTQDVRCTLEVALAVEQHKQISWTSRTGRPQKIAINRWLCVDDALKLPEPDTSWMRDAWKREKFTGWMR